MDSRRVANGRFGPGWYFAQPIPFTVPCEMQARGERGEIILDRYTFFVFDTAHLFFRIQFIYVFIVISKFKCQNSGATVGIVFVFEDGRHSTAILADGEQCTF